MRRKHIMWLSLIAVLLSVMMVNLGSASVSPAKLFVDPATIKSRPPGEFTIDINVEKVTDLYAYGMTVDFAPYVQTLVVSKVTEGPFLKQGGTTYFRYQVNSFQGEIHIGCTLLGAVPGVSGDGNLFSVTFIIVEGGESQLDLLNTALLNSNLQRINHKVEHGEYHGPYVKLIRFQILPGRDLQACQTAWFTSRVKNMDEHMTAMATVRFDFFREEGFRFTVWAGQNFVSIPRAPEYLYVNEYNEWLEWDWTNPGASIIGDEDGNYAESIVNGAMTSVYGFDDLTLDPGDVIGRVTLEGYCQYPNGPTEDVDIDVYTTDFHWLGSLYGSTEWGWVSPRWIDEDVSDVLPQLLGMDASALNDLEVLLYNYYGNAANPMRVDALRLRVEFSQVYPIGPTWVPVPPDHEVEMPPVRWKLEFWDVGKWYVTATCLYTYTGYSKITDGSKTRSFKVNP